jgi:hypothetical protein
MRAMPKVADLDAAVAVDHDVRRLDVAVYHAFAVRVAHAVQQLPYDLAHFADFVADFLARCWCSVLPLMSSITM